MKKLKSKISNRVKLTLERTIPYRYHYKPVGVHPEGVSNECVRFQNIYTGYENPLKIEDELFDILSDYDKPDYQSVTTDYHIIELDEGRVFAGNVATVAVISKENKIVGEASFSYKNGDVVSADQNNVFQQKFFPEPEYIDGTVFTMLNGGGGASNYAHFLIDSLSRIHLLKKSGKFDEVDKFLVPSIRYDFQEDALKLLGITRDKIIEGDKVPHIQAKKLIASTAPRHTALIIPSWVCEFYRDEYLKPELLKDFDAPYIYIKRSDSGIRNVLNEAEVEEMLSKYGFKFYELRDLSFIEKVSLFAKAKVVVSVHGAGLTNIMFCSTDSHFIELYPDVYILTTYVDLATKVGIDYAYQLCKSSAFADNGGDAQKVHVTVDIPKLEALVKEKIQ